jgi:hypothetical protein
LVGLERLLQAITSLTFLGPDRIVVPRRETPCESSMKPPPTLLIPNLHSSQLNSHTTFRGGSDPETSHTSCCHSGTYSSLSFLVSARAGSGVPI